MRVRGRRACTGSVGPVGWSACLLAIAVAKEERCARMGHTDKEATYWSSYRNTTSTVGFQALRHGVKQGNVAARSSVFLNTDNAQPLESCFGGRNV